MRTILALALALIIPRAQAEEPDSDRWRLMNLMHTFEREFSKLRPYLVSDEKFSDPKARPEIQQALKSLEEVVKAQRPKKIDANPNFSLNFSLMSYHLQRVRRGFEHGGYAYARRDLNATAHFCATCHTQTSTPKQRLGGLWSGPETDAVTYENAEFLFITRRFDQALEKYSELLRKYPKSGLKLEQVEGVFNRKLALFARVMRDPQAAIESFKKDLQNKELPAEAQANAQTWIKEFESWKNENPKIENQRPEAFMAYVGKSRPGASAPKLAPSDSGLIRALRVSGKLYELLVKDPGGKFAQEILYDLALYERQLSQLYWYSLYQSYLRECVLKYPKKPLTKTCFDLYEADIKEEYAADLKSLPEDMRSAIEVLRKNI